MRFVRLLQIIAFLFAMVPSVPAVEIIAHRGASADAPENSLSAMKLAWEQNADAVELDIWLSKDGKILVFHDADTKRIGGVNKKIAEYTLEEAQQLDVGAWKAAKFKGERMPSLESILETVPAGKRAVIEIKAGPEIVPELVRVLRSANKPVKQLAIISFKFDSLAESKRQLPEIEHYFLHGYKKDAKTGQFPTLDDMLARAKEGKFDGLDLHFDWPINRDFVSKVKAAGLKLVTWTVNDAEVAAKQVAAGVDGITTDRPAWLREQLRSR